jgi:hypothetical protein
VWERQCRDRETKRRDVVKRERRNKDGDGVERKRQREGVERERWSREGETV